jgi:hypothetical protein
MPPIKKSNTNWIKMEAKTMEIERFLIFDLSQGNLHPSSIIIRT